MGVNNKEDAQLNILCECAFEGSYINEKLYEFYSNKLG
jgi:hypothetical protein